MLKILNIIILLFNCQLAVANDDLNIILSVTSSANSEGYIVFLTNTSKAEKLPKWSPADNEPPISKTIAINYATEAIDLENNNFELKSINLMRAKSPGLETWFYQVSFIRKQIDLKKDNIRRILILMNGEAIKGKNVSKQEFKRILSGE